MKFVPDWSVEFEWSEQGGEEWQSDNPTDTSNQTSQHLEPELNLLRSDLQKKPPILLGARDEG